MRFRQNGAVTRCEGDAAWNLSQKCLVVLFICHMIFHPFVCWSFCKFVYSAFVSVVSFTLTSAHITIYALRNYFIICFMSLCDVCFFANMCPVCKLLCFVILSSLFTWNHFNSALMYRNNWGGWEVEPLNLSLNFCVSKMQLTPT